MGAKSSSAVKPVVENASEAPTAQSTLDCTKTESIDAKGLYRDQSQLIGAGGHQLNHSGRTSMMEPRTSGLVVRSSRMTHEQSFEQHVSAYDLQDERSGTVKPMPDNLVEWLGNRNSETLQGAVAFVPWIMQQAFHEGTLKQDQIVVHRGSGAVVFSDASGFTALTERLAKKSNGAELLSQCLAAFFTPLIDLINAYRGDVIKFSGDALVIYFPAVDDTRLHDPTVTGFMIPPHGSYDQPDIGPMSTAVLRASACCIEIHRRLHNFDTGVDGVRLCLHIGVGCGEVAVLSVGGVAAPETHVPRCEYIICGPPLEQISIAEPLAKNGETCLSPQAWEHVRDCVVEGAPLEDRPDYHLLLRLEETKFTFPTIKYSAMETDTRDDYKFRLTEVDIIRRYIPSPVFKQIQGGTLQYVNEMRNITSIFISGSGVDVSTDKGAVVAQDLMAAIQTACYGHEGTVNKFVIDDKGMLFLLVFGLPPLVHTDDPTRAVLSCLDMVHIFKGMGLVGRFGITTGRAYCGVCGSAKRMEYTVLGDTVNTAARIMSNAPQQGVLCDEQTKNRCTNEVICVALAPIMVKGKKDPVSIFQPSASPPPQFVGLGSNGRIFFPWYDRPFGGMTLSIRPVTQGDLESQNRVLSSEELMKNNVSQLCSLSQWPSIIQVQAILGETFSPDIHKRESMAQRNPTQDAPVGSPFEFGGIIVLEGKTGDGKIELADHIITYTAVKLGILPIFGTMGPRIGDEERLGVELVRSTLGVFRHLQSTLPVDDMQCLMRILPPDYSSSLPLVREAMGTTGERTHSSHVLLAALLDLFLVLLEIVRRQTSVLVVLQLEVGTNLFAKTLNAFSGFWEVVQRLYEVAVPDGTVEAHLEAKPVSLLVLSKVCPRQHKCVRAAIKKGWHVKTDGLSEESSIQYMAKYLNVPTQILPQPLRQFIVKITMGNPLYIRETVDQLLQNEHVKVLFGANAMPESLQYHQDLEGINIAAWAQTAMVGETSCLLESLDPLEAAVVKMSTVFSGNFTLADLASSNCSRWAGATMFDQMRLFRAVNSLVDQGILEVNNAYFSENSEYEPNSPVYSLCSVLIRKVGGSMLLEAQRRAVKRQALINRVLAMALPDRMYEVHMKKMEPHVPWYYENILSKACA